MKKVVVYLLFIKKFWAAFIMNSQVSKAAQVIIQGTGSFTVYGETFF